MPLQHISLFFFSSRRRHTRLQGDWSSDVCSPDLTEWPLKANGKDDTQRLPAPAATAQTSGYVPPQSDVERQLVRSEERRVGKEGIAERGRYHGKYLDRPRTEQPEQADNTQVEREI